MEWITSDSMSTLLTGLLTLATGLVAWANTKLKKKLKAKEAVADRLADAVYQQKIRIVKELFDLQRFSGFSYHVHQIFQKTKIDRVSVMFIMNGTDTFRQLTTLFDISKERKNIGNMSPYHNIKIDREYVDMISKVESRQSVWLKNEHFGLGEMDDFMHVEQITHAGFHFVQRIKIDDLNDLVVFLCTSTERDYLTMTERKAVELMFRGRMRPDLMQILKTPTINDSDLLNELENK